MTKKQGTPAKQASSAKQPRKRSPAKPSPVAVAETAPQNVTAPPTTEPAAHSDAGDLPEVQVAQAFTDLIAQVQGQQQQLASLKASIRALEKTAMRELKAALKGARKGKKRAGARAPSGFVKPTQISKELASFLGKPPGTEMARTEVTKEINKYIREHDLQDPANGRHILANKELKTLLKLSKQDELTYFNLQRFMSPHFAKATPKPASSTA